VPANLSEHKLHRALTAAHEALGAAHRYQSFLLTGLALPRDEVARLSIVNSNSDMMSALRTEIGALEAELHNRRR
jgi:hypothetical protein